MRISFLLFCTLLIGGGHMPGHLSAAGTNEAGPWRLSDAVGLPGWLDVSGTHRARYETLDGQFRALRSGGDQVLAFRTTLRMEAKAERVSVVGEMVDSRQELADLGTPINTTIVNALEPLQVYGSLRLEGPFVGESSSEFRFGRQTMDVGSRRLVARNRFRNTINAFTGLDYEWRLREGPVFRAFYVLPVRRMPRDPVSLLDNDIEIDHENFDYRFWGLHAELPGLVAGSTGEAYVFGLHEDNSAGLPLLKRNYYTPGVRLLRKPGRERWDFDMEAVLQAGNLRNSVTSRDLDHLAYFGHAELGYTLGAAWAPRVALLYDYASGDDDPTDSRNNRFDTLFGARRFEHGPTGIYGAFARSNIQSPGVRFSARPTKPLDAMVSYRPYWLASKRDAWTTSGLRDPSGNSGSFVGHQLEARLRWSVLPGNVGLEVGGAYLFAGEFIRNVPSAIERGDTAYAYCSADVMF
ncbi:MAG: hypothetical protein RI897_241 [Verrucomicrobiota bacterium]